MSTRGTPKWARVERPRVGARAGLKKARAEAENEREVERRKYGVRREAVNGHNRWCQTRYWPGVPGVSLARH
jgi:hypothetical protein